MIKQIDFCYRVYGDNVLECELFIDWLKQTSLSDFKFIGEIGPADRPILIFNDVSENKTFGFHLCPFYGGTNKNIWPTNQLDGIFNEKPDVLLVKVDENNKESSPILVAEFDDALQAGNQAWQRARRSVDAVKHGIPYFYILPLIGWERDSNGKSLKNPRYQNAGITLGQLTLSSYYGTPSLQIYKHTPWDSLAFEGGYAIPENFYTFTSLNSAIKYASFLIRNSAYGTNDNLSTLPLLESMIQEMFCVAKTYSDFSKTRFTIHHAHDVLNKNNLVKSSNQLASDLLNKTHTKNNLRLDSISESHFFSN